MGVCKWCGEPAGFLSSLHAACKPSYNSERASRAVAQMGIHQIPVSFTEQRRDPNEAVEALGQLLQRGSMTMEAARPFLLAGIKEASEKLSTAGASTVPGAASALAKFAELCALDKGVGLIYGPSIENIHRADRITQIVDGKEAPNRLPAALGIVVPSGETPIWGFEHTKLFEDKTHTKRVGHVNGVSVRVHKGVYYHAGHFQSQSRTWVENEHVDTGVLYLTNKAIYYAGSKRAFKIPFGKIVSIYCIHQGIEILKEGASAKPEYFITGDAWFTVNLISQVLAKYH